MANDHIPRPDAQFRAWQANLVTYGNGHLADSGLVGRRDGVRDVEQASVGVSAAKLRPAADSAPSRLSCPETLGRAEDATTSGYPRLPPAVSPTIPVIIGREIADGATAF